MVLPVRSAIAVMNRDNINSTVDFVSMPSTNSVCMYSDSTLTAGMVNPMLASAEPSARLRLVCRRLARAARNAAKPSGSRTIGRDDHADHGIWRAHAMHRGFETGRQFFGEQHHGGQACHQ